MNKKIVAKILLFLVINQYGIAGNVCCGSTPVENFNDTNNPRPRSRSRSDADSQRPSKHVVRVVASTDATDSSPQSQPTPESDESDSSCAEPLDPIARARKSISQGEATRIDAQIAHIKVDKDLRKEALGLRFKYKTGQFSEKGFHYLELLAAQKIKIHDTHIDRNVDEAIISFRGNFQDHGDNEDGNNGEQAIQSLKERISRLPYKSLKIPADSSTVTLKGVGTQASAAQLHLYRMLASQRIAAVDQQDALHEKEAVVAVQGAPKEENKDSNDGSKSGRQQRRTSRRPSSGFEFPTESLPQPTMS